MFTKKPLQPEIKTLKQLQHELAEKNNQIELQQISNLKDRGFIPLSMKEQFLEHYQKEKEEIEKQIAMHPDSNISEKDKRKHKGCHIF